MARLTSYEGFKHQICKVKYTLMKHQLTESLPKIREGKNIDRRALEVNPFLMLGLIRSSSSRLMKLLWNLMYCMQSQ